ncbi:protein roadkill [Nephila pilipes]|uniref:Protein roadkill n=1 Tax=Nephila pilipes TaxID=299642 RepID=A0A8X6TAI6_NEPPI|nr:protein roadkill [Nephila pilipes]
MAVSKLRTYNSIEVTELEWTVDNYLYLLPDISSPVFSPFSNSSEKWCLILRFNDELEKFAINLLLFRREVCISTCNVKMNLQIGGRRFDFDGHGPLPFVQIQGEGFYNIMKIALNVPLRQFLPKDHLFVIITIMVSGFEVNISACPPLKNEFQKNNLELLKDLGTLYRHSSTADVTFEVGGQTLGAHSNIIRCRSPVFARMLDQDMREKATGRILITDADFSVFDAFLLYLYTAQIKEEKWEIMYSLYSLAEKYAVVCLKQTCSRWLGKNMSVETVCKCLLLADLHDDQELKQEAKHFVRDHLETLATRDWQYVVSNHPQLASEILSFSTSNLVKRLRVKSP